MEDSECAVCHQHTPKTRVHYGGVSCYSCRAFFRRNTQREEVPPCKERGECDITYTDRKLCTACRYKKCLRVGMAPCLVLNEDDKRIRFKKHHEKKKEELNNFKNLEATENQISCQRFEKNAIDTLIDSEIKQEEEEEEDDENQAQNYTQAFLTIQQYRAECLRQIRASVLEESNIKEPSDGIKTEYSPLPNQLENPEATDEHLEKPKPNIHEITKKYTVKAESNQRFRQLLELSHKAAIYAKLQDTEFPTISQYGFPASVMPKMENENRATDFSSSEEENEMNKEEPDVGTVSFKKVYLASRNPEQEGEERLENKYHHKKFRTYPEQEDISTAVVENRKRKSVIVRGPNCKKNYSPS